jgi:2-enoate reductase
VVVIGGGWVGLETAEFLIQRGGRVTVIEMLPELGRDVDLWNRWVLLDRLEKMGLDYRLEAKAEIITPDGVMVRHEGRREFMPADTVVVAVGAESNVCLGTDLVDLDGPVVLIGDCQEPKRVKDAVETGFLAGMRV